MCWNEFIDELRVHHIIRVFGKLNNVQNNSFVSNRSSWWMMNGTLFSELDSWIIRVPSRVVELVHQRQRQSD